MGIFDMLKNESGPPATANSAVIAVERPESVGRTAKTATLATATPPKEETEIPPKEDQPDPVSLAERIGIKYESETPSTIGKPVIVDRGVVLACENDLPHVRMYAWALINMNTGEPRPIDLLKASRDCRLTIREVREAMARLVTEKDLIVERTRKSDLYKLNIQYGGPT